MLQKICLKCVSILIALKDNGVQMILFIGDKLLAHIFWASIKGQFPLSFLVDNVPAMY